ncbi:LOW QUALITY PROTEIN: hypothetical protein ACHAWF_000080, partial [Thalassiosira exigua]
MRLSVPRNPSSASLEPMESPFVTNMPTIDGLRTTPSFSTAASPISRFLSVNGIAEKAIHNLTEARCKQLLFVKARWPEAISMSLWPACNGYLGPRNDEGLYKLDLFGNLRRKPQVHPYIRLTGLCVVDSKLTSGKSIKRWDSRAQLGLNLGQSPSHARNISLVLSLTMGL